MSRKIIQDTSLEGRLLVDDGLGTGLVSVRVLVLDDGNTSIEVAKGWGIIIDFEVDGGDFIEAQQLDDDQLAEIRE